MSKLLVAYFSASGITKSVAQRLAKGIGADLFEIHPEIPYSSADLDWRNKNSRSSVEMNDIHCRPAIHSKAENMAQYDAVFVGFPVWWYREPSIIDTFIESYDFNGKIVIPFATSGGSGIGRSGQNMSALAPNAKISEGQRFSADISETELADWAEKQLIKLR